MANSYLENHKLQLNTATDFGTTILTRTFYGFTAVRSSDSIKRIEI